jgi:hypothetical protein
LPSKCIPLPEDDIEEIDTDCWLVTPVIDEVPVNVLKAIVKDVGKSNFVMLKPKGLFNLLMTLQEQFYYLMNLHWTCLA